MAKIVIVGLGAGGFAAILAARKTDRNAEIVVIDRKDYDLMHPCGIPYAVEGAIGSIDSLKHDLNMKAMRVAHYKNYIADNINLAEKTVRAHSAFSGDEEFFAYDKLIISTGSTPLVPPVEGLEALLGKGAFTVATPEDASRLRAAARAIGKALVIGAGAIGLETASALSDMGCETTVVETLGGVFPRALDPDMAAILQQYLEEKKIALRLGSSVQAVRGSTQVEEAVVDGETVPCSIVVVGAGVRPNSALAADAGLNVSRFGVVTDEKMLSSDPSVYAVGDCAETFDLIRKHRCWMPLSTIAYRQGTIAGANAAGADETYKGVVGAFVSKVGEMEIAAVGLTSQAAVAAGFDPVIGKLKDLTRPDWYPNGREITVKVIADKATRKVLGAQAVGSGAAWRVNVVSAAISSGMSLEQLSDVELAYCPPVSQTYDCLSKAADLAIRKIK
ncbi:MAG: putative NADH oxidase [bacterium ADurb.Bin236]|nr:MAG: putative NADH oxidase [bacterium ADurb.Bin236]HOY62964.1 FAD-dependent oxidoreductase [bacterium]HPN95760.1 FAD-dependent oxidoreductase [bacterium]